MMTKSSSSENPAVLLPEPFLDPETYTQRLSKLQIESDVLLNNKPLNHVRLNKNKMQLFELLKRHNERKKISTEELPRTYFYF